MEQKEIEKTDTLAHATKMKASFSWRRGIQLDTEGFSYEQNEALLEAFISSRRIVAYWLIIVAVVGLTALLGGNVAEVVEALSQPP